MKTLLLVACVTVACGPRVLPDTDPQIVHLRALHQDFLAITSTQQRVHRIDLQLYALRDSAGIEEQRLPLDLRDWIHDLRTFHAQP